MAWTSRCALLWLLASVPAACGPANVQPAGGGMAPGGSPAPGPGANTGGSPGGAPGGGFNLPPATDAGPVAPDSGTSSGGPVPGEACAAQVFTPQKVPVDMHILLDSSAS